MKLQKGDLVDVPRGTWCGDTKNVAASLESQANSGHAGLDVLNELRQLAEMQSFISWARDNGITLTNEFRQIINQYNSTPSFEVPSWTSGIKTDPRVEVQQRSSISRGSLNDIVHVSLADFSTAANCVLPNWNARLRDFPANGVNYDTVKGKWITPQDTYQFIDSWMAEMARKIAVCSRGNLLTPVSVRRVGGTNGSANEETQFGIELHAQGIHMHGGVLLGVQRDFLETAWREKGLLLSPIRRPFFQREGGNLHFWNFIDNDPRFGSVGHHVVIKDGVITGAFPFQGHMAFMVETKPGAIVRQELRVGRADKYSKGLELVEARHGSDGSRIWNKAAWPCVGEEANSSGCVQLSELTIDGFEKMIGDNGNEEPAISLAHDAENSWIVAVNLSVVRSELDHRWEKIPSSDLNSKLTLIYEYAKWGFMDEAMKRYKEIAAKIEGNTVDTILLKQLESPPKDK